MIKQQFGFIPVNKGSFILTILGFLLAGLFYTANAQAELEIKVYKNPSCGCCGNWVDYLEKNGFSAEVTSMRDRRDIQTKLGVPQEFGACHTAVIDGYFIEGHVPAAEILRLLKEKPDIAGLSVPSMPVGSPGMENPKYPAVDYQVFAVDKIGNATVYGTYLGGK